MPASGERLSAPDRGRQAYDAIAQLGSGLGRERLAFRELFVPERGLVVPRVTPIPPEVEPLMGLDPATTVQDRVNETFGEPRTALGYSVTYRRETGEAGSEAEGEGSATLNVATFNLREPNPRARLQSWLGLGTIFSEGPEGPKNFITGTVRVMDGDQPFLDTDVAVGKVQELFGNVMGDPIKL